MQERDQELEELLRPLRDKKPNDLQMRRWQALVEKEWQNPAPIGRQSFGLQHLVAAMLAGFILGAAVMKSDLLQFFVKRSENSIPDATVEYIYAKSE